MKPTQPNDRKRRMQLHRETLRTLTPTQLGGVVGGIIRGSQCTYDESGCINIAAVPQACTRLYSGCDERS